MWVTSQAAGNMTASNEQAMTAPGSQPVDPLPPAKDQGDPTVQVPAAKPPVVAKHGDGYTPSPVSWKKVD
jgi:hypothetical protein